VTPWVPYSFAILYIQPLLDSLLPALTLGILDDFTLGGAQQSVAADVNRIIEGGQRLGLHLNMAKCEVLASPDTVITTSSDIFICYSG